MIFVMSDGSLPIKIIPLPSLCTGQPDCMCYPCARDRFDKIIAELYPWLTKSMAVVAPAASCSSSLACARVP